MTKLSKPRPDGRGMLVPFLVYLALYEPNEEHSGGQ